jgi:hypothetical protein
MWARDGSVPTIPRDKSLGQEFAFSHPSLYFRITLATYVPLLFFKYLARISYILQNLFGTRVSQ